MAQFNIFQEQTKRETGRKAQHGNILAAKVTFRFEPRLSRSQSNGRLSFNTVDGMQAVADVIRSTLGPRSMLKMLLDPNGGVQSVDPGPILQRLVDFHLHVLIPLVLTGIVITNDGNAILREIDVSHPAAKVRTVLGKQSICRLSNHHC
jgi:hypothetical protein